MGRGLGEAAANQVERRSQTPENQRQCGAEERQTCSSIQVGNSDQEARNKAVADGQWGQRPAEQQRKGQGEKPGGT